jgi:hypothetical protein
MLAVYALMGGLLAAAATAPRAQEDLAGAVRISGPVLGYFFDRAAATLRPLLGIPGAATMGAPMGMDFRVAKAAISPLHDYLLAQVEGEAALTLVRLDAGALTRQGIVGALESPERIVFSPAGTAAVLSECAEGTIQVLAGLPGEPAVAGRFTVPGDACPLTALAVSDDARVILAGFASGATALLSAEGQSRRVWLPGAASSIAFFRGRHDAVIASRAEKSLYLLRDAGGADEVTVMAREADGVGEPVAVETSWDGRLVLVANAGTGSLLVVDTAGGPAQVIASSCRTTGLHRLAGNAVFRLDESCEGPMTLLDADGAEARLVFVPATTR